MEYESIVSTIQYGRFTVELDVLLKEKNISKTRLSKMANTNYKNIKRLCDGNVQKIDLDIMVRICYVLKCGLSDIIKYEHPRPEEERGVL